MKILKNLTLNQIKKIEQVCEVKSYKDGDYIVREGEDSTDLYFIVAGAVNFYKIETISQREFEFSREMSVGESFGEMAFFDGLPRSCSVKATSDTQTYILSRQKFLLEVPDALLIFNIMSTTIIKQVSDLLRLTTDKIVVLQNEIHELKTKSH